MLIARNDARGSPSTDMHEFESGNSPANETPDAPVDDHAAAAERMADCHPSSPFKGLDWRWKLAWLLRDGFPCPGGIGGDRWFHSTLRLRVRMEPRDGDPRRYRTGRDRQLDIAHQIRFGADHRRRLELEARLLSGQDFAAIARHLGVEAEAVEAYGRAFYDVADRLDRSDYIRAIAIGPSTNTKVTADQIEVIVKLIAFNLGPLAVDALGRHLGWPAPIAATTSSDLVAATERKLETLIGVMTLLVDDATAPALIRIAARLREVERRSQDGSNSHLASPIRVVAPLSTVDHATSIAHFGPASPLLDARMGYADAAIHPPRDAAPTGETEHQVALSA